MLTTRSLSTALSTTLPGKNSCYDAHVGETEAEGGQVTEPRINVLATTLSGAQRFCCSCFMDGNLGREGSLFVQEHLDFRHRAVC